LFPNKKKSPKSRASPKTDKVNERSTLPIATPPTFNPNLSKVGFKFPHYQMAKLQALGGLFG